MKKLLIWMLSAALCISLAACAGKTTPAPANTDTDTAVTGTETVYQEKISELEQADGEIHWAVFPCGTGEKILAVASSVYADGQAAEADIYQYADGEVHKIASVSSTGTAYPLAFTGEAVLFGGNHTAGKLVIHDGTAELYQLVNMNIEGKTPVVETYDVADGAMTLKSSEEVQAEEVNSFDYYTNAFADEQAEVIEFRYFNPHNNQES